MIYILLFIFSLVLTYIIKIYAIKKSIMDIPNDRSSHSVPTPRGGGLAIMICIYMGITYMFYTNTIDASLYYALLASLPIVIVSLIDDIITLSSKVRFLVQLFSALLALYFLGGVNSINFGFFTFSGWWLNIIALFSIIWLTNLYNFLDGIDGYAGSQAIIAGLGSFILINNEIGLLIAISSLGFLFFNWPKASIFMGDVGSATLGFLFAILCFSDTSNTNIFVWLILLSLFWFDATITLMRRYRNGEKVTEAHKKHAYQRLNQSGLTHKQVTIRFILVNAIFFFLMFLLPVSYYGYLFLFILLVLYCMMKYIDSKKEFL